MEVLRWVVEGCPQRDWPNETHKTSAVALQNRRLVTVSRKNGAWKAVATDAGRYFAEHGTYPPGHWPEPAATASARTTRPGVQAKPTPQRRVSAKRPVEQMLDDLTAALTNSDGLGGLVIAAHETGYYTNLARSAERYGKVPPGKQIVQERVRVSDEGYGRFQTVLNLVDQPAWMTQHLDAIPVPQRLTRTSPAPVRALSTNRTRLRMKAAVRGRALRILDAIAREAVNRGYPVDLPAPKPGYTVAHSDLAITIQGHTHALRIEEPSDRVPHEPTTAELREKERYPTISRIPTHDQVPSGRLRLRIDGWSQYPGNFEDRKTIALEDQLPKVMQALELRAAEDEERRLARVRDEEARKRHWDEVRATAVVELREHHRSQTLNEQAARWAQHQAINTYLDALEQHLTTSTEPDDIAAAHEWLDWARAHQRATNPLSSRIAMPADPEATPTALQPFMRGLSPYGLDR